MRFCEIGDDYNEVQERCKREGFIIEDDFVYMERLFGKYNEIKEIMEESYGTKHFPVQSSFNRKFKRGNNNEMKYLDDAHYMATFFLPLFHVEISIQKDATIRIQIHDNIYDETILKKRDELTTEIYK